MMAASGHGDPHAREIAAGLVAAVRAAIAAGHHDAPKHAWAAAADVAELLDLPGLHALLGACAGASGTRSAPVEAALDRLQRIADEAEARGDLRAFARADRELATLAASPELADAVAEASAASTAGSGPVTNPAENEDAGGPEDVRSLSVLLADFAFDDPAAVAKAMVTLPVAAGLRAALDWIAADAGGRMHVEVQDAALTLVARAAQEGGLGAAGAVLGLTGGALLPEPDGRWSLRVPLHAARPAFLLVRQGGLALALPWHAVARLRITDEAARATMTEPSLEPWSVLERRSGERPAALLALGLSRAWLHLDHIVWRVFARPEPAENGRAVPGGTLMVRTEEGEEYRVVDVEQALRGVPPLHTPEPGLRRTGAMPGAQAPRLQPVAVAAVSAPEPPAAVAAPAPPVVLGPEFVRALGPVVAAPTKEKLKPPAPAVRRVLVVDDSLVTRMELGRVLERRGWEVEWVETAAEMWSTLPEGEWSIVFVDASLPDARASAHLKTLVAQQRGASRRFELVALTRDEADERLVRDAGITRMLRKPFAPGVVERMARELRGTGA